MYHVLSTGITAIILYLISYFLYRAGFFSRSMHNRIWNFIMAAISVPAVLAGLFLALQITYKWDFPFSKSILKWHVETGIAFAFTGLFHLIWHLPYFISGNHELVTGASERPPLPPGKNESSANLFLTGFVSTTVQLILMREMMNIAGGYELIAGVFLASWLTGSAAGSFMAKNSRLNDVRKMNSVFASSIIISLVLLVALKRLYFLTGESPGFLASIIYTLIVVFPCTFASGFLFMRLTSISDESGTITRGRSFSTETAGGVMAGVLVSAAGTTLLNNYQLYLINLLIFPVYLILTCLPGKNRKKVLYLAVAFTSIILIIALNPDRFFRQLLLAGIKVEQTTDTPYGNITGGSYGGEKNLYYDHHLFRWQKDEAEREENTHYAMLQHPDPEKVLVISGDITSLLPEIKKYNVSSITFVERDPVLVKKFSLTGDADQKILRTESMDALRFIRKTSEKYDVILLNLPPPSTLMINRFYTKEFFMAAGRRLGKGGVFACSPGTGSNYFNEESAVLYSSIFNSMSAAFRFVIPVVGNKLYLIGSEDTLKTSFASMVKSKGILNSYVNENFLSDELIKNRSDEMMSVIDRTVRMNTLLFPVACFHFQNYRISLDRQQRIPALVLITLIFLAPLLKIRRREIFMYSSAGALAGFEIIMLLVLQSSAGNMYQFTGLILAGFMAGLAIGSGCDNKFLSRLQGPELAVIMVLFYMLTGVLAGKIISVNSILLESALITLLSFLPSILTGRTFRIITEKQGPGSAASVYSADMAGAALGFIVFSGFAVPLLGIRTSLFLLSAVILTGFLFGTIRDK